MTSWYYSDDARNRHGPLSAEELLTHYRQRRLRRDTLVWREGLSEWVPLQRVAAELDLDSVVPDASLPPPIPSASPAPMYATRPAPAPKKGMSGCLIALLVCAVIAIPMIGILAAIAIPAYQDYTVRAKVMRVTMAAAALKPAVAERAVRDGKCPEEGDSELAPLVQQLAQHPQIAAVRLGTVDGDNCAFELTLRGISAQADGKTVLFEARHNGNQLEWDCSGGDLPSRYRPMQCRTAQ